MRITPPGYGIATKVRPEWLVGYLTFQGGIPRQRMGSLTGGGQAVANLGGPPGPPVIVPNTSILTSIAGGGMLPARPFFAAPLAGGASTTGNGL